MVRISITRATTRTGPSGKPYTVFTIEIRMRGHPTWEVRRRFKQFVSLQAALRSSWSISVSASLLMKSRLSTEDAARGIVAALQAQLPKKKLLGNNMNAAHVEQRRARLERYLKILVGDGGERDGDEEGFTASTGDAASTRDAACLLHLCTPPVCLAFVYRHVCQQSGRVNDDRCPQNGQSIGSSSALPGIKCQT